jgi:hypothetical protein
MVERRSMPIRCGGFTAVMDRPTNNRSSVGCSDSMPGVSNCTCAITRSFASSFTMRLSPISVTYQNDPSGSIAT